MPDHRPLTIVIADDHPIARRGLRQLLSSELDCTIVAEAEDVESLRSCLRTHHPDVLVTDLNMPGESLVRALGGIHDAFPKVAIVILTMQSEPAYAERALTDGALGYVLKDAVDQDLISAVRAAAKGERYLNPRLGAKIAAQSHQTGPGGLSAREVEVLALLALGYSSPQAGEQLHISARTVDTHRLHIQRKLNVRDRRGLVEFAFDHGVIGSRIGVPT